MEVLVYIGIAGVIFWIGFSIYKGVSNMNVNTFVKILLFLLFVACVAGASWLVFVLGGDPPDFLM